MVTNCPACQSSISFDIAQLKNVILKFECPSCSQRLSLSNNGTSIMQAEEQEKLDRMTGMVQLALADGTISDEEMKFLQEQAKTLGIRESVIKDSIAKHSNHNDFKDSITLVEEYSEDKQKYMNDSLYDFNSFMKIIANLSPNHSNLKNYRDDLLEMIMFNAEMVKDLGRRYEMLYKESTVESDWIEYKENMDKWLEHARILRGVCEELKNASKKELIEKCKMLTTASEDSWD